MKTNNELLSPSVVALRLGFGLATIKKMARSGGLPGAVFLPCGSASGRQHIMFDPHKIEAFIEAGGTRTWPECERFLMARHGGRSHAGMAARSMGRPGVALDIERTVKRDTAEGNRKPGEGPTGYEPRFLGAGRNVTDDYPWNPKVGK